MPTDFLGVRKRQVFLKPIPPLPSPESRHADRSGMTWVFTLFSQSASPLP